MVAGYIFIGLYAAPNIAYGGGLAVTVSGVLQLLMMLYFVRRHKIKFNIRKPVINDKIKHCLN